MTKKEIAARVLADWGGKGTERLLALIEAALWEVAPQPHPAAGAARMLLSVVCAWCGADLGTKPCAPEQVGKVSHGICESCAEKFVTGAAILEKEAGEKQD